MATTPVALRIDSDLAEWSLDHSSEWGFRNRTDFIENLLRAARDGRLHITPRPMPNPDPFPAETAKNAGRQVEQDTRGPRSGREIFFSNEEVELAKVRILAARTVGADGCWRYFSRKGGYAGSFTVRVGEARSFTSHRASFAAFHGTIPQGMVVMHSCDNHYCFNPAHLSIGLQSDNAKDRAAKGRMTRPKTEYIHEEIERCLHGYGIPLDPIDACHTALMRCWVDEGCFASRYTLLRSTRASLHLTEDPPGAEQFGPWNP